MNISEQVTELRERHDALCVEAEKLLRKIAELWFFPENGEHNVDYLLGIMVGRWELDNEICDKLKLSLRGSNHGNSTRALLLLEQVRRKTYELS